MRVQLQLKISHIFAGPNGRDPRVRHTIDFFAHKKFLRNDRLSPGYRQRRVSLTDVLWACEHAVPELYQLVPVAALKFSKYLSGRWPEDLKCVVFALQNGQSRGPSFRGHSWREIHGWLDFKLTDRRTSRVPTKQALYRLPPDLVRRIRDAAKASNQTASALVAQALEEHLNQI